MNPNVLFLTRNDCRDTRAMLENTVKALKGIAFQTLDVDQLPPNDIRRGYGAPSILVEGEDLFGMPEPTPWVALQNRKYPIGIPSEEEISARFARRLLMI